MLSFTPLFLPGHWSLWRHLLQSIWLNFASTLPIFWLYFWFMGTAWLGKDSISVPFSEKSQSAHRSGDFLPLSAEGIMRRPFLLHFSCNIVWVERSVCGFLWQCISSWNQHRGESYSVYRQMWLGYLHYHHTFQKYLPQTRRVFSCSSFLLWHSSHVETACWSRQYHYFLSARYFHCHRHKTGPQCSVQGS